MFPEGLVEALSSDRDKAVDADFQLVDKALTECAKHNGVETLRPRLWYTLRGLLAGTAYVNALHAGAADQVRVTAENYREVYRLLNAESVRPPSRTFDSLTLPMVHRANAWLAFAEEMEKAAADPEARGLTRPKVHTGAEMPLAAPRLITLPEIKELGKTGSASVEALCRYLRDTKTFEDFKSIGVREDCGKGSDWPTQESKELAAQLIEWSPKQARDRFDQLRKAGVIAATRSTNNGPWRYHIPKDAFEGFSPFAGLPSPESLKE